MTLKGDVFDTVRSRFGVSSILTMLVDSDAEPGRFARCPICGSSRMQITRDNRSWSCWAGRCHETTGRDALGLAAGLWQISRHDAAVRLLGDTSPDRLSVRTSKATVSDPRAVSDDPTRNADWQGWIADIVKESQKRLADPECPIAKRARVYLCRTRGLAVESVKAFSLGLNLDWVISHDVIPGRKLVAAPGIVIPWAMPGGLTGAIVREFHEPLSSKYLMLSGSRRKWAWPGPIFAWDHEWAYDGPLVIVEGELDAIAAGQCLLGLSRVITIGSSTSGPKALADSERSTLARFPYLLVAADSDAAGNECREMWANYSKRVHFLTVPPGYKDLGECLAAGIDLRDWYLSELARLGIDAGLEPGCYDE